MANPHGTPIWYELMTKDPAAAKAFYDKVIGWSIADKSDYPGMDYRMIDTASKGGGGDFVGGVLPLTQEMCDGGAFPTWLFYLGVDDVDAAAARIKDRGGAVHMEPFDVPDVGRMAMVADPQGNPFYIMRGASDGDSTAWSPMGMGKCSWNELSTTDQTGGNAFYADVFGWTYPDKMVIPEEMGGGEYVFVDVAGQMIGATMSAHPEQPAGWQFYFRAPDIQDAAAKVKAAGGTVLQEPMEVPGGDMIIVASDPEGVRFGVVAPGEA